MRGTVACSVNLDGGVRVPGRLTTMLFDIPSNRWHHSCIYNGWLALDSELELLPPSIFMTASSEIEQSSLIPCLCAQTRRVDRLLNRIYDDALRPLGINTMQKSLLTSISRAPGSIDSSQLCQRLALDRSTLTRNLTTLERMGLVSTTPNTQDRRKRTVALTQAGRATVDASEPLWREAQSRVVHALGYEHSVELLTMLADAERTMRELDQ